MPISFSTPDLRTVEGGVSSFMLAADSVGTAEIQAAAVGLAELANLANATVIGRNTSGTGVPEAVTMAQLAGLVNAGAVGGIDLETVSTLPTMLDGNTDAFKGLASFLLSKEDTPDAFVIQVIGDSTGNDTTDWVYQWGQTLAALYGSTHRVVYNLYNDSTKEYGTDTVLAAGPSGEGGIICNGTTVNASSGYGLFPLGSFTWLAPGDNLEVIAKVSLADWTPSTSQPVMSQYEGTGSNSWMFGVHTDGTLYMFCYDGTRTHQAYSTAAPTVSDGAALWIRATCDIDNGASGSDFKFYTSANGVTWTQLGTTVTKANALTSVLSVDVPIRIGGRFGVTFTGTVYRAEVKNMIDGKIITPYSLGDASLYNEGAWTGSKTLRIVNGSVAGWNIATSLGATNIDKAIVRGSGLTIVNLGHNQSWQVGQSFLTATGTSKGSVAELLPAIRARRDGPICWMIQNPETSSATAPKAHRLRAKDLLVYQSQGVYSVVDIRSVFLSNASWEAEWMTDTVHPNSTGSAAWAAEVQRVLSSAMTLIEAVS